MDFFASQGVTHVLEMGPGSVLSGLFRRSHPSISCLSFSQLSSFQQLTELLGHFD
jgi:malonyl CoA-acyl carrier protein transacylase